MDSQLNTHTEVVVCDGATYTVRTNRFDDEVDVSYGAVYHGVSVHIQGNGIDVHTKKYDDSNELLLMGISDRDTEKVLHVQKILNQLFVKDSQEPLALLFA